MNKQRVKELKEKAKETLKEEGVKELFIKTKYFMLKKINCKKNNNFHEFKDVLFINGCSLPHPQRYRVDHQIEQLEAYGISCSRINYEDLNLNLIKYYRAFVFYRCPIIPVIESFIKEAKDSNKTIFYDIDDLVFDLKYTNQIRYLDSLNKQELDLYKDGVKRMGQTLKLCDYGITTTKRLQKEMSKYLKDVVINRNVASEEMIKYSEKALKSVSFLDENRIVMGYLSGSITHNDDFKLIMPAIIKLMEMYNNLYLQIVGLLDLPAEMMKFKDRILNSEFMSWKKLPELICSIDINLAPLEQSIFNEAKSENKWMEAALCKVPTVASNVGAFKEMIDDGQTGILCSNNNEWIEKISKLIDDSNYRKKIGLNAYKKVHEDCTTINTGKNIADFILNKLKPNAVFVLPSTNVSGGIMVACKHASILKKYGYDVTLFNTQKNDENVVIDGDSIYVVSNENTAIHGKIDMMIATMWVTVPFVKMYFNCNDKRYLVQGYETQFYQNGSYEKIMANSTYNSQTNIKYLTVSKWCEKWLKTKFNKNALYTPNGINIDLFKCRKSTKYNKKVKILIEGNCKDYYKNVDESFKITNKLDKNKFEIHYLSYEKEPKSWYKYDYFYHKIPHEKVSDIYRNCDILLKTSILESFSYPPLEMMATGGTCVVVPNEGNIEYLKNNINCLFYEQGNYEDAIKKIESIVNDKELKERLINNGLKTAQSRDWKKIENDILNIYKN